MVVVAVAMVVELADASVRVWKRAREGEDERNVRESNRRPSGDGRRETRMDAAAV